MRRQSLMLALALSVPGLATRAGAQTRAGGEFIVNTTTTGYQAYPTIGRARNGNFVVAWADASSYSVLAQRFDRSGARLGAEFTVNSTGYGYTPGLGVGPKGEFVVAWSQYDTGATSIQAQRFDAAGNRLGAELAVNSYTGPTLAFPRVAVDGRGSFVVTWWTADGSGTGIAAQRFDGAGARLGSELLVNTYTTGNEFFNDVAADAAGNFVIAWTGLDPADTSSYAALAQRYDASGGPQGANFVVNADTLGLEGTPGVAYAPDGSFIVAFLTPQLPGGTFDVFAKRYTAAGAVIGVEFQVNTYTTNIQGYPSVGTDSAGNFVVSWLDFVGDGSNAGVRARRFRADGSPRGDDFIVNAYTTGAQVSNRFSSILGSDEVGNFVVDWVGYTPAGLLNDIYAQRFGGLHPSALNVNTTGNLVWEPGETVDVKPSWFNANGAAQTVGGALASLGGPAGATYTINDGAATYGTIANNTSGLCTDCYQVTVTNPATRPVQHWDASAVETLSPDTQGQAKKWALHIGNSFNDVPTTNAFYRFIETLLHYSVTGGCGGGNYCPGDPTSRAQMSVFVLVAKEGISFSPPACTTPVFSDVPASSAFCRFIEELFRRGVVSGCGGSNFCPNDPVTREQMAVFVLRTLDPALNPPACTTPVFGDVPASSPFCRWIEELFRRGVVSGCGGGNYCPGQAVTREQMAVFIVATFGLKLYGV